MPSKKQPADIFEEFYDRSIPCEDDESVILIKDKDKVACDKMDRGALNVDLHGTSKGKNPSKSKAEDNLHDAILDAVDSARKKAKVRCDSKSTTCTVGFCYTTYEIDSRRTKFRKAKRKGKVIWLASYKGRVNHYCICVV